MSFCNRRVGVKNPVGCNEFRLFSMELKKCNNFQLRSSTTSSNNQICKKKVVPVVASETPRVFLFLDGITCMVAACVHSYQRQHVFPFSIFLGGITVKVALCIHTTTMYALVSLTTHVSLFLGGITSSDSLAW